MNTYFILVTAICIYFFGLSFVKLSKLQHRFFLSFGVCILVFAATFRPHVFPDTSSYENIFNMIDVNRNYGFNFLNKNVETSVEYGFLWLIWIIKKIGISNTRIFFFLIALLQVLIFRHVLLKYSNKNSETEKQMICMILPYFGIINMFVTIRVGLAFAIALLAFVQRNRGIKSLLLKILNYVIAFSIHRIIILFILLEMITHIKRVFSLKTYVVIYIISIMMIICGKYVGHFIANIMEYISENLDFLNYSEYLKNTDFNNYEIPFRVLYFCVINSYPLLNYKYIKEKNLGSLINVAIVAIFVSSFFCSINGISRIYDCFNIISIIYISTQLSQNKESYVINGLLKTINMLGLAIVYRLLI